MTIDTLPPVAPSAPVPQDPSDIAGIVRSRGVLVSLEITTWSGRKLDKRVTSDTNAREGADPDASRTNKNLLGGKVPSFAATVAAAGAARSAHYAQTLPWGKGVELLPIGNYFKYAEMIRSQRAEFKAAVDAFLAEYSQLVQDAKRRLGGMFSYDDYPSLAEIERKFTFRVQFNPVPAATDIRLDLPPEVLRHMEKSITARVENAVQGAVREGWERMAETVTKLRDTLSALAVDSAGKRLHDSLFQNAIDTAETLRRMNVLEDPALDAMAARIVAEITAMDPKLIRKDPDAMKATADKADAILASMAGMYGAS